MWPVQKLDSSFETELNCTYLWVIENKIAKYFVEEGTPRLQLNRIKFKKLESE